MVELTAEEARRIALSAQGFAQPRPAKPGKAALRKLIGRVHQFQLDPINVVVRAHYMPAFSRLGPYDRAHLDALAYKDRALFEYIGHAAALIATDLHPFLRWRMHQWTTQTKWQFGYLDEGTEEVREHGAMTPNDLSFQERFKHPDGWSGSYGKQTMQQLMRMGVLTVAARRGIEQVYDLTERVLPASVLAQPTPNEDNGKRELLLRAARALGVATATDLGDYFLIRNAAKLVDGLVADGSLLPATVKGWNKKAYVHPDAKPKPVAAAALVSPFDSLIWTRDRVNRLFGFDYRIEIYVPAPKRRYGYYVYPFLMGEDLVARVDLKGDRKASALLVQGAFAEPTASAAQVAPALATELHTMARWLGLDRVEVKANGDLAPALRKAV
jgi:uncharacterized protein YcaQ